MEIPQNGCNIGCVIQESQKAGLKIKIIKMTGFRGNEAVGTGELP